MTPSSLLRALLVLPAITMACTPEATAEGEGEGEGEGGIVEGDCVVADGAEFARDIGCSADFAALASESLDAGLPGARSVKVVVDRADGDALYFMNSVLYPIHHDFVSTHLSGGELPVVPDLGTFNTTEYFSPERRFILAAVTFYEGADVWALELSPYDTADLSMITTVFEAVKSHAFFGPGLRFHPTSESVAVVVAGAPIDGDGALDVVTTDDLYNGIDYQPLSLGTGFGHLQFHTAAEIDAGLYLSAFDIVVLDQAPNDISVVQGLITEEFQTPLSHINVLSANRRTPNMGLRGAMSDPALRALEGKLVELTVTSSSFIAREASQEEADAYFAAHLPSAVTLPPLDLAVTDLRDLVDVTPEPAAASGLRDAIAAAVPAFGGKAAHYSILLRTDDVPAKSGFAIPVFYYVQFMAENGFDARIDRLMADAAFVDDAAVRDAELAALRDDMLDAPVNRSFQNLLHDKIDAEYAGKILRFRTSTNSEDLDGFPCAGCYESHSGDTNDFDDVLDAIKESYASTWLFRTFEERTYYGVDHHSVGMALMVHENFPDEEANGVAVTANIFDESGLEPAFTVNVQFGGEAEVVHPPAGVTSDQLLYWFTQPNQPTTYISHSNLVDAGVNVLSNGQLHELGVALDAIHSRFSPAYGPASGNDGFYAMDIEFKFDDDLHEGDAPGEPAHLFIKQARPYPGRGQ